MGKFLKRIGFCLIAAAFCWILTVMEDRITLNHELIRFHVVANSDSSEDQRIKLMIRDVVLDAMEEDLKRISSVEEARSYLRENLPKLQILVDETLSKLGFEGSSLVSLCKEPFDTRYYDTFTLPAGVYHSLRIVIGEGMGKNWWCVSFPALCLPATSSGFANTAVSAGFSAPLIQTLSAGNDHEIRFFFLEQLGKLDKILCFP